VLVQELIRGLSRHFEIVLVSKDTKRSDLPEEFSKLISAHLTWQSGNASAAAARELAQDLKLQRIDLAHFHLGGTYEWRSKKYWECPIYYLARAGVPCLSTNHLAVEWLNCGVRPDAPIWQKFCFQVFALISRSIVYRW